MGRRTKEESTKNPSRVFSGSQRSPQGIERQREYYRRRQQTRRLEMKGELSGETMWYTCKKCPRKFTSQRGLSAHRTWMH